MGDENETAAFDVTPQKTMTCGRMLSILVYMIGTVICEMIFDKLIVLALLVLVPVCIAAMRVQEKKRGLSVCGRTISVMPELEKAYSSMDVIPSGISISRRAVHPSNRRPGISRIFSGIRHSVSFRQPAKAPVPKAVTDFGTCTLPISAP